MQRFFLQRYTAMEKSLSIIGSLYGCASPKSVVGPANWHRWLDYITSQYDLAKVSHNSPISPAEELSK